MSRPSFQFTRFSDHIEDELSVERRRHLASMAEQLGPWVQGPFPLGADLVLGADRRSDMRWEELRRHIPEDLSGKRVLVVGSNAGYDAFMFHLLGADLVLACEPSESYRQAAFLESVYDTGVAFRQIGWQDLTSEQHGLFDAIHCPDLLHRELHQALMLGRLKDLLAPGAILLIGCALLDDSEGSEYVRFIEEGYDADPSWWWVPGRRAIRRLFRVTGLDVDEEFEVTEEVPGKPADVTSYFRVRHRTQAFDGRFPAAAQTAPVAGNPERVVGRSAYPPGHFYSSVPDLRKLAAEPTRSRVWPPTPHPSYGIDWRGDAQLELCRKAFAEQVPLELAAEHPDDPTEYFGANEQFSPLDAWVLQAILRELRPARMIEMGSGFSSLVSARVNREFLGEEMRFTCIEPYPREFLLKGVPGITDLRVEEVQDTPLELFDELGDGDVLFVDTSHTVKTGGEVPWIFSQIIPRLNPGVAVHIHDVFLPGDYPKSWVLGEARNWNENYLVESFLLFNSAFEVLLSVQWMIQNDRLALLAAFPDLIDQRKVREALSPPAQHFLLGEHSGSSLWLQRRR